MLTYTVPLCFRLKSRVYCIRGRAPPGPVEWRHWRAMALEIQYNTHLFNSVMLSASFRGAALLFPSVGCNRATEKLRILATDLSTWLWWGKDATTLPQSRCLSLGPRAACEGVVWCAGHLVVHVCMGVRTSHSQPPHGAIWDTSIGYNRKLRRRAHGTASSPFRWAVFSLIDVKTLYRHLGWGWGQSITDD